MRLRKIKREQSEINADIIGDMMAEMGVMRQRLGGQGPAVQIWSC